MRILILSPFPVDPPVHGGRVRTMGIARGLARAGATVTVLCPWIPFQRRVAKLEPRLERRAHSLVANLLPALLPARVAPPLALLSLQPVTGVGVRRRLAAHAGADVWQFEFCAAAPWMRLAPPGVTVVYSAHNVESDFVAPWTGSFRFGPWARRRIEALEREAVRRSRLVVACSEADAARLAEIYGAPRASVVAPNGLDPRWLEFDRSSRDEARGALGFGAGERVILFLGGAAAHNREALEFLERSILPRLGPHHRLLVVGHSGDHAGNDPRIRRLGFVPDLRRAFAAADLAVNPVAFGSGTNVKLAEYLAAGLPVITTPIGVRGFPLPRHPGLTIVERERFAEEIAREHPSFARDRRLAELSWDRVGANLLETYREIRSASPVLPIERSAAEARLAASLS